MKLACSAQPSASSSSSSLPVVLFLGHSPPVVGDVEVASYSSLSPICAFPWFSSTLHQGACRLYHHHHRRHHHHRSLTHSVNRECPWLSSTQYQAVCRMYHLHHRHDYHHHQYYPLTRALTHSPVGFLCRPQPSTRRHAGIIIIITIIIIIISLTRLLVVLRPVPWGVKVVLSPSSSSSLLTHSSLTHPLTQSVTQLFVSWLSFGQYHGACRLYNHRHSLTHSLTH